MRRILIGSLLASFLAPALLLPAPSLARDAAAVEARSQLDTRKLAGIVQWIEGDVERGRIPGAVVLVAQDGKVVSTPSTPSRPRPSSSPPSPPTSPS